MSQLRPYQQRAVDFGLQVKTPYYAIDMGLGKTYITLALIAQLGEPAMILGPLSTILNTWPAEIEKWFPGMTYRVVHGLNKSVDNINGVDVLLMNYDGLAWFSKQRLRWKPRIVVYDESTAVKSGSTQRFKMLKAMDKLWCPTRVCLSATPAPNSLIDLWSQYYLLDSGARLGYTMTMFRKLYCHTVAYPGQVFTKWEVRKESVPIILDQIKDITFRLRAEDYLDMPDILYSNVEVTLSHKVMKQYKELEKSFYVEVQDKGVWAISSGALSMKLRQLVQGGVYDDERNILKAHEEKVDVLCDLIESADSPVLVAIMFKSDYKLITDRLGKLPLIAGGVSAQERARLIRRWNDRQIPVLLAHPGSLAHGVNLQFGGSIIIWYALTWSLEQYIQLNGRLHRYGQDKAVRVYHIVAKGTVDEKVSLALREKRQVQDMLLEQLKMH